MPSIYEFPNVHVKVSRSFVIHACARGKTWSLYVFWSFHHHEMDSKINTGTRPFQNGRIILPLSGTIHRNPCSNRHDICWFTSHEQAPIHHALLIHPITIRKKNPTWCHKCCLSPNVLMLSYIIPNSIASPIRWYKSIFYLAKPHSNLQEQ